MNSVPMFYLGSPFWHTDANIRLRRRLTAQAASLWLMRQGVHVFAPLSHSHMLSSEILQTGQLTPPENEHYWRAHGANMVPRCNALVVLMLRGWKRSTGLRGELDAAHEHGVACLYLAHLGHSGGFEWNAASASMARRLMKAAA